jgi:hypothetical protein
MVGAHPLRTLSERGDIIRTMQRAMGQAQRELVIFDPKRSKPVIGRIANKGQGRSVAEGVWSSLQRGLPSYDSPGLD